MQPAQALDGCAGGPNLTLAVPAAVTPALSAAAVVGGLEELLGQLKVLSPPVRIGMGLESVALEVRAVRGLCRL